MRAPLSAALLLALASIAYADSYSGGGGGGGTPGGTSGQIQYNNSGSFGGRATSGNGTVVGVTSGTLTSGHYVGFDASGNLVDSGTAYAASLVTSIATACPTSAATAGDVTVTGSEPVNAQSGTTYTILGSDCGKLLTLNNGSAVAVALPQAGTAGFPAGFFMTVQNRGAGLVTITPATSTINGSATITIPTGASIGVVGDGANYFAQFTPPGGTNGQIQYNNSGAFGGKAVTGNGANVATSTGSLTNGDCVKIDANGNLIDAGTACGTAGPAGSSGDIQYNNSSSFGARSPSGNGTSVVTTTGSQTSGDCVQIDANGNHVAAGVGNCTGDNRPATIPTNAFYSLNRPGTSILGGSVFVVAVTYCAPFEIKNTVTIDELVVNNQTNGGSNSHAAIYANAYDSTNHHYYPSATPLVSDNNNPANNATQVYTFASPYQLTPATYWACFQANDTNQKAYAITGATVTPYMYFFGSAANSAGGFPPTCIKSSVGVYGTWPNSSNWTGNSWSEVTSAVMPNMLMRISSVP